MKCGVTCCLFILSVLFVLFATASLSWRFQHDAPLLLYFAYSIDNWGLIPYRDIFDFNMPGAYWAYILIGRLSGYVDVGVRFCDLGLLGILSIVTFLWQRKLSYKIGCSGVILFGIAYLSLGPEGSLQREYIALVPASIGIYLSSVTPLRGSIRCYLVGFLFGLSAIIKPPMVIGIVPIILLEFVYPLPADRPIGLTGKRKSIILSFFLGVCTPLLVTIAWLYRQENLRAFLDMALNYWPLYTSLSYSHQSLYGIERAQNLYRNYKLLGGQTFWLIPGALGFFIAISAAKLSEQQNRQVILLGLMTICYSVYPVFGGQFWSYHWLPFIYFATQLSSLCLIVESLPENGFKRIFPLSLLLFVCLLMTPPALLKTTTYFVGTRLPPPSDGRVDQIATYLQDHLRPSDTVQPLDWTGGAIHAMLLSKAKLATPFPYDFYFYHDISKPYIKGLRRRFVSELLETKPRFIIDILDKPHPSGHDTTREFPELFQILNDNYRVAFQGQGFVIYEGFFNGSGGRHYK